MILLIDNYDSFSYNVYQWIGSERTDIQAVRNDEITIGEIKTLHPQAIVLSPGPKRPRDAGICMDIVQNFYDSIPILGICLGHQVICEAFGATVTYASQLMHGKQDQMYIIQSDPVFENMGSSFKAARYHSLSADPQTIPSDLVVLARSEDAEIMAVRHKKYPIYGFQFHPESVMTPKGNQLIQNFIHIIGGANGND